MLSRKPLERRRGVEPEKDAQRQETSEVNELKVTFRFNDLIICTPPPITDKVCHALSLSHSLDTDNGLHLPNHREKPVGGSSPLPLPVCVHISTTTSPYLHTSLVIMGQSPYTHDNTLATKSTLASPLPGLLWQHHFPHRHLLIKQT